MERESLNEKKMIARFRCEEEHKGNQFEEMKEIVDFRMSVLNMGGRRLMWMKEI